TIITHVELSEIVTGAHPNTDPPDTASFAQQHLNRIAVATADPGPSPDSDESSNSTAPTDEDSEATPSDEVGEQGATGAESSEDQTATDPSIEDTPAEDSADSTAGDSAEEQLGSTSEDADSTPEDSNETTTLETTKVLYTTATRTRKVHVVTKHVTKRVRKPDHQNSDSLSEPSPVTTNKTISIVTPTFPLPIARCPRADQPCIGAGFACNGYEFGQCVNNRWLMRPCSTDRVTACFNAGPDLIACDFPKGRSLQ
ncbi:hypothetical protein GGI22_007991, partial [Coemansia erecta]